MAEEINFAFRVAPDEAGQRLDVFLAGQTAKTRSAIQKLIKAKSVRLNGGAAKKSGIILEPGDKIEMELPPPQPDKARPEAIPLKIVFEDKDIIVVNKPAGLVVHPAAGHAGGTLVNALLHHCKDLSGIGGVMRPGIVHRLDKETSGLIVAAKNDKAHLELSRQFKAREVKKTYLALVEGRPRPESGLITGLIGRHARERKKMAFHPLQAGLNRGKEATSSYKSIGSGKGLSLVEIRPLTGRTHQIRVQLAALGCPLAGDIKYGGHNWQLPARKRLLDRTKGHFLHAWKLGFSHPISHEALNFQAPLPEHFQEQLKFGGLSL